jgi:ribosomal protein L11 methyltransferase
LAAESFRGFRYSLPAALEDEVAAWLWRQGTSGSQVLDGAAGGLLIDAFFPAARAPEVLPAALQAAGVRLAGELRVSAADWLASHRAASRPLPIGQRLLVDPREPGAPAPVAGRRIWLRVPARTAFGTGSHESTRLVLELMEGLELRGKRVLDVGTGSGILALVALAFGARSVVGFDLDLAAPLVAAQNAALNRRRPALYAGGAAALGARAGGFDLLLANVVPEQLGGDLAVLVGLVAPGGEALISGVLASEGRAWLARLRAAGLRRRSTRRAGEWVAYRLARVAA